MADLNTNLFSQMSFSSEDELSSYFFITNQKNLLSFLSCGMIVPSGCQFRYREDSRELFSGAIPFWKGGIPDSGICKELLNDRRAVVIECTLDDLEKYGGSKAIHRDKGILVLNAPLPIRMALSFYMPSREVIDDFLLRVTDDVVLDASLFQEFPEFQKLEFRELPQIEFVDISSTLTLIDRFAGGVNAIRNYPGEIDQDLSHIVPPIFVFLASFEETKVSWAGDELMLPQHDEVLLSALFPLLVQNQEEDGFDPLPFLDDLRRNVEARISEIPEDLNKWFLYVRAILNAEKEVKPLSDEGDIIQRAILLFILRPRIDRLVNSYRSAVAPGPKVMLIAAFLSGCASGVTRMAGEFKGDFRSHGRLMKSLVDAVWGKTTLKIRLSEYRVKGKGACTAFELNGETLFEAEGRQDPVLARVLNQARSLGYELQYDQDNDELVYDARLEKDEYQRVHIERLKSPSFGGLDAIRFVSPCLSLSSSKMRSLRKDQLLELLHRNNDDEMYCAFALSAKRRALVVEATQIVNTMDDDEFVTLLDHVKKVASEYR